MSTADAPSLPAAPLPRAGRSSADGSSGRNSPRSSCRRRRQATRCCILLRAAALLASGGGVPATVAVGARAGNMPSVYVPVLMPPAVTSDVISVTPEELVRAAMPWDGMEMRADDAARWNLDRYNDYGAHGKRVEIPIAVPPTYHGSGDLDKQRDAQLNMDNWINVVEAPTLPDSAGPAMYSGHQKPAGYYRNPFTVPKISFLEVAARAAGSARAVVDSGTSEQGSGRVLSSKEKGRGRRCRSLRGCGKADVSSSSSSLLSSLLSTATHDAGMVAAADPLPPAAAVAVQSPTDGSGVAVQVHLGGSGASGRVFSSMYPRPGERPVGLLPGHPLNPHSFGGYDAAGFPSPLPGVASATPPPARAATPVFLQTGAASSAVLGSSVSSVATAMAGVDPPYNMLPYLKMRALLRQFSAFDQDASTPQARALDVSHFVPSVDQTSWLKPPQAASRSFFFPTGANDQDSNHPQHKADASATPYRVGWRPEIYQVSAMPGSDAAVTYNEVPLWPPKPPDPLQFG